MRVLEITSELDAGGVERLLYDYCSRLTNEIEFDFVVTSESVGMLEKSLLSLGCKVFHVPRIRGGFSRHCRALTEIINNGCYDIIHDHSGYKSFVSLRIAKRHGVCMRIAHSHQAKIPESIVTRIIRMACTLITVKYATNLAACGLDAAKWMWGRHRTLADKVFIMPNAISTDSFLFNSIDRDLYRKKMKLKDEFVIGNVARFSAQKNHSFLVDVFFELHKTMPNAVLLLVGRGELLNDIQCKVEKLGIKEKVLFLGVRDDVSKIYNAMDLFLLPSLFEGLPVTLVEIQANGLPALISDSVTKEICLNANLKYEPLENGPEKWAKVITGTKWERCKPSILDSYYNIDVAASLLRNYYFKFNKNGDVE